MAPRARGAGNLPAELTSFVGRRGELAEVRRLLAGSRLVTLTGVGGVGKTRLALRAAAGSRRAFPGGVWLVRLDQLRDEALVAQAVAGALGLQDRPGYSPAAALAEYLAGRQLLLVLDNCEHLVDAAAKLADQLLRAAAGLRVLATSREALTIDGEMVLPVPPLAAPEAGQPLTAAELARFPAVRLFAERAAQVVPGFAVTEANVAAVAGICCRLEGLPLAIELAAARLPVLSPQQIDARLGDRLGLLTRGGRTRPARQQTLRASIEWSYELCSRAERLLWARLSVFAGGFELDAAEGICGDYRLAADEVLDLLAALAGKSILTAAHGEGVARYRLPEPLREYGQERLHESGEHAALRRRHRDWHEQLARRAETGWLSPQMTDWAARLYREHANVNAAQDFCQAEPGEAEAGLRIALHVWILYYWGAGHVSEGRYRLGQVLAQAGEPTVCRARGLLLAGFLAAVGGDRGAARALLEQGTSLAGRLDDPATRAFAACIAGTACLFAGDLPQATAQFEDGLAVLPVAAVGGRLRALLLTGRAMAAGLAGYEQRAVACHRELAALTEAGSEYIRCWSSAWSLWALGAAAWRRGDLDRATGLHQQSLRLRRKRPDGHHLLRGGAGLDRRVAAPVRARRGAARRRHRPVAVHGHDPGRLPAHGGLPPGLRTAGPAGPGRGGVPGRLPPRPGPARRRRPRLRPAAAAGKAVGTGRIRWGAADAAGAAGGPPDRRGPQQQGHRRRAGDLPADRRKPRGAHPDQARLHLPGPGRRLGRRVTTGG